MPIILKYTSKLLLLMVMLELLSCQKEREATPMDLSKAHLIPKPLSLEATGSSFLLHEKTIIYCDTIDQNLKKVAELLAKQLRPATGFPLQILPTKDTPKGEGNIYLKIAEKDFIENKEAYKLYITKDLLQLEANAPAGIYRGLQTLRQLLPASIELSQKQSIIWEIPTGTIEDAPDYEYRGAMLDVSRHFFGVKDVKKFIDYISSYKMNVLHLHLSDDQGWRIEIKSWPNLTAIGGKSAVGGGEGGFFTQEQYMDIVNYASERFITVIPEIDMPGHTNAALASYAELNCDGKIREPYTGTKVGFSSLCTDKEITYLFVDDVIKEIAAMTPGPYIHIGGDESHATKASDYTYFINRTQEIVNKHGKRMIGWEEVQTGNFKSTSVAQFWSKAENAVGAIAQNAKVIMSPAKKAYLDMKYHENSPLGLDWAAHIEVDEGYNWDPANHTIGVKKEHILGIEAPLWSETIENMDDIEYLLFPRLLGYAEIGWTPTKLRDWDDYKVRLANQKERFEVLKVNYYESERVPWAKEFEKKDM